MDKNLKVIIVGNSPNVLKKKYGSIIDSYDIVIRINKCTTNGFEKYIGTKTDIWATTHLKYHKDSNNDDKIFIPNNYQDIKQLWRRTPKVKLNNLPSDFPVTNPYTMFKTKEFYKNKLNIYIDNLKNEPCTGLLTILTSTLFYQDITIYGFSFYTESSGNVTSYYRELESKNGKHREDKYWKKVKKSKFASIASGNDKQKIITNLKTKNLIKILK